MSEILLVNSRGFSGSYRQTACSSGIHLQAGEEKIVEDGWHDSARKLSDLMKPESIAETAVRRVTRLVGARKIPTQNVPVVFEPQITGSMLRFLSTCVLGESIYLNQSFLAGKLGQTIASPLVTVIDDGLIPGAPGSRPFDAEGVPTRRTAVIDRGVFRNYLTDTYSSRKLKIDSTGNCPGTHNFFLEGGSYSTESILGKMDRGLLVTGLIGQGMVPTTGELSRGVFGLWIEGGQILYPVSEVTISGNLGKMLLEIEMIGNDLTFRRSVTGPTIKIAEMTIAGMG